MAKIGRTEDKERIVPTAGRYKYVLSRVLEKVVDSQFGKQERFIFVLDLTHKLVPAEKKGDKPSYQPVITDGDTLQVTQYTNKNYGHSNGSLTVFLDQLIEEHAPFFMDSNGDTDALLGRRGEVIIANTEKNKKTYANIVKLKPNEEDLNLWAANGFPVDSSMVKKATVTKGYNKEADGQISSDDDFDTDPFDE